MPWCLGPWPRHGIAAGWDLRRRSCRCMAPRETQLADTHCMLSCQAPRTLNRGVSEEKKGEARALAFRTHFAHRTPSLPPPMKSRQSAQGSPLIQKPGGHVGWLQSLSVLRHRSGGGVTGGGSTRSSSSVVWQGGGAWAWAPPPPLASMRSRQPHASLPRWLSVRPKVLAGHALRGSAPAGRGRGRRLRLRLRGARPGAAYS